MSKYDSFQTTLTEEGALVAALKALGYPVEIHTQAMPLFGYHGDERPERAHIIIRRNHLDCASNDIGFVRNSHGQFSAILSEYDRSIGFDQKWLNRVHQRYKEERTLAMARQRGYVLRGRQVIQTEQGEQVKLLFGTR
jgi:Protein of unknown function (DUF1257)